MSLSLRRAWMCGGLIVVACGVLGERLLATPSAVLHAKDIDQAIEWGMNGDPGPYLLHHMSSQPGKINPVVVGLVYTPFVRVALAARAARKAGRNFASSDIAPTLPEPIAHVAFRWYCCAGQDRATFDPRNPADQKIAVPGDRVSGGLHVTATPLSITRDLSVLKTFGGELPYSDVVLVAVYPISAFASAGDFIIYKGGSDREGPVPSLPGEWASREVGRITSVELARWR